MLSAYFYSLGCRLNHFEIDHLKKSLYSLGYTEYTEKNANVCVINTCTVTSRSDSKCKQLIRKIQRDNPKAVICVIGCFSQMASDEILEIGGIDILLGNLNKMDLPLYLNEFLKTGTQIVNVEKILRKPFTLPAYGFSSGVRANLKIQDGCDFYCTF